MPIKHKLFPNLISEKTTAMKKQIDFVRLRKTVVSLLLTCMLAPLVAQTRVRGSIGKALAANDSTKVVVYALPDGDLNNIVLENINVCISIPDQGIDNPEVYVSQNHAPSLNWIPVGSNPEIINGRAYYTFIGNDNNSNAQVSWPAGNDNPVVTLSFKLGIGQSFVQLNDLSDAGGVGSGGGTGRQSFWYVQANTLGDITDHGFKFYQSPYSKIPLNGGLFAPSSVETIDEVALPIRPTADNTVWQLYPSPTPGPLKLLSGTTGMVHLRIFDTPGRLVWEKQTTVNQAQLTEINEYGLSPGSYLLDVRTENGQVLFTGRFVIME